MRLFHTTAAPSSGWRPSLPIRTHMHAHTQTKHLKDGFFKKKQKKTEQQWIIGDHFLSIFIFRAEIVLVGAADSAGDKKTELPVVKI